MVSVPLVLIAAAVSPSDRVRVSADRIAASLVPRILMVTEVSVPSALLTLKLSVWVLPAANSLCAELAV